MVASDVPSIVASDAPSDVPSVTPLVTGFVSSLRTSSNQLPDITTVLNLAVEFYFSTVLVGASIGVYLFDTTGNQMEDSQVFNLEEGQQLDCLLPHGELQFIVSPPSSPGAVAILNLDDNTVLYAQSFTDEESLTLSPTISQS